MEYICLYNIVSSHLITLLPKIVMGNYPDTHLCRKVYGGVLLNDLYT
jgi:hypothetical protein